VEPSLEAATGMHLIVGDILERAWDIGVIDARRAHFQWIQFRLTASDDIDI